MKTFLTNYGAYLVAALLFVSASILYCFPAMSGKVLYSSDNINARCAAAEETNFTQETGQVSYWCDSMFSGMPSYQIKGGQYKADQLLAPLKSLLQKGHHNPIWALILYFCCFFLLFLSLDIDKWLSIIGSFALTLSSYFLIILAMGHNTKTSSIALMCAALAGFFFITRGKYGVGAFVTLVATAVGITTHPQMTYYVFMLIGILWIAELPLHIRKKTIKGFLLGTAVFAGCAGVGLLANSSNVFANSEFVKETVRGGNETPNVDYVTSFSYGPLETFSLLIPGVTGGSSSVDVGTDSHYYKALKQNKQTKSVARERAANAPLYWGGQPFTSGNVYVGAIVCFLFLLGLLLVPGPKKWGLAVATLLSLLLASGGHIMPLTAFFVKYVPLYSKFRAVSSILVMAEIAMPLLGFLALQSVLSGSIPQKKAIRALYIAAGVTAGICLLFAIIGPSVFSFKSQADSSLSYLEEGQYLALIADREALLLHDCFRSAGFILAAAAVLLFMLRGKRVVKKEVWAMVALGVLVVWDLWQVDRRYLNENNFVTRKEDGKEFAMMDWEKELQKDPGFFRVYNLASDYSPFYEARTSLYSKSVGGYNAAKLRRYDDLINQHLMPRHITVFGMLNTKYFILPGEDNKPQIMKNPAALGNAWFVDRFIVAQNDQEESEALMKIDLQKTAVVGKEFEEFIPKSPSTPDNGRTVVLTSYAPNMREYECLTKAASTLVFSEIWYPYGWKAFIDDSPAPLFRVNYLLRAINVPEGKHTIHMVFDPDSVKKGNAVAIPAAILVYLALAAIFVVLLVRRLSSSKACKQDEADA